MDVAAQRSSMGREDIEVRRWTLKKFSLGDTLNWTPVGEREGEFEFINDVFDYRRKPKTTLLVDYAAPTLGGGYKGHGLVQEEQMVGQPLDFQSMLEIPHNRKFARMTEDQALVIHGIRFDLWWNKEAALSKCVPLDEDIIPTPNTESMTAIAVDAPKLPGSVVAWHSDASLLQTVKKIQLIYKVAAKRGSTIIMSGLLG
jgi:hypothetical protein